MSSFFKRLLSTLEAIVDAFVEFIDPSTTPAEATVVSKHIGQVPMKAVPRAIDDFEVRMTIPVMVEAFICTVTIPGVSGIHEVEVPFEVYENATPGNKLPAKYRPSRLDPEVTRVSYA